MATHEREVTEAVDLCDATGRLAPEARGFSRLPLQRANLSGRFGRTKRWDYWAILAGDLVVAVTYASLDYLGLVDVYWADLATGRSGGRPAIVPLARGMSLPDISGETPIRFTSRDLHLDLTTDARGATRIRALYRDWAGGRGALDATVEPADESLNVVIPWSDETFQFTSKHTARPARGELVLGGVSHRFGESGDAWGVLDVGRGRWPRATNWNWGSAAGHGTSGALAHRPVVGLQLGGKWTVGTGFTENGFFVDGKLTKIGPELEWQYDFDRALEPWHVRSPDGSLDARLVPRFDRHTRVELGLAGSHVHQVFGRWSGHVVTDDGLRVDFRDIDGFAEECRARW